MSPTDRCAAHDDLVHGIQKLDGRLDTWFKEIGVKMDAIHERLGRGDVAIAELHIRVDHLERVVYGLTGAALLSLVAALVSVAMVVGG